MTAVAPVNLEPVMVTLVPGGPLVGEMPVTVGILLYMKLSASEWMLVPLGVLTVTSTISYPAGDVAVTRVSVFTE